MCNTIQLLRNPAVVSLHHRPIPSVDWTVQIFISLYEEGTIWQIFVLCRQTLT